MDLFVVNEKTKGPWSPEEDAALQELVGKYGAKNWSIISRGIPGRSGKSCRLRWCNQLSPDVEHHPFTEEEDAMIIEAHALYGNKWATIARLLPGRTDNAIKNHWNSSLRRRRSTAGHYDEEDGQGRNKRNRLSLSPPRESCDPTTSLSLSLPGFCCCRNEEKEAVVPPSPVINAWASFDLLSIVRDMVASEVQKYHGSGHMLDYH